MLCNSLFNIVLSASDRIYLVMLLHLLLVSRTSWYASSHSVTILFCFVWPVVPSWTTLLQSHVRYNSTGEAWVCFYYKRSFHALCVYTGVFFGNFLHHLKIKRMVSLMIYTSRLTKNGIMSWIACKWPFQFFSLYADIKFFNIFSNFNNVSRCRTIPDIATDLSVNSLYSTWTSILTSRQIL